MHVLRRLHWKYRKGLVLKDTIQARILEVGGSLVTRYRAVAKTLHETGVDSVVWGLRKEFDKNLDASRETCRASDFATSLACIETASKTIGQLELAHAASEAIRQADGSQSVMLRLLGESPARNLATVTIMERLLVKAQELWDKGEFRQSCFVADMAQEEVGRLLITGSGPTGAEALEERLRAIEASCVYLAILPWTIETGWTESCLTTIRRLLAEKRLHLAAGLTDDLELQISPQIEFTRQLTRMLDGAQEPLQAAESLLARCGVTSHDSWRQATQRIIEGCLSGVCAKLDRLDSEAGRRKAAGQTA